MRSKTDYAIFFAQPPQIAVAQISAAPCIEMQAEQLKKLVFSAKSFESLESDILENIIY